MAVWFFLGINIMPAAGSEEEVGKEQEEIFFKVVLFFYGSFDK